MTDLKDRIALVTGASRGLGYAVAKELGARGAHVVAVARTVGGLEELDGEIQAAGGQATLVPLDVTDDGGLERMGAALFERWGHVDLWVHTAVQAPPVAPVEHVEAKDLDKAIAVNLRAVQRLIRVVDPLLRRAEAGRAVFCRNTDVAGRPHHAGFRATVEAGLDLAEDWGGALSRTSVARVVVVTPPPMPTAVRARFYPGEDTGALTHPSQVAPRIIDSALAAG